MVNMFVGTPGSGKSLNTGHDILSYVRRGSLVVCNFNLNLEKAKVHKKTQFVYMSNKALKESPKLLVDVISDYITTYGERHVLVVLDECQLLFDSRNWNVSGRDDWLTFFNLHRKIGHDHIEIILVTPNEKAIDKRVMGVVEYISYHRKIKNFGAMGFLVSQLFNENLFYVSVYWKPINKKASGHFFIGRKKYFRLYDTLLVFE